MKVLVIILSNIFLLIILNVCTSPKAFKRIKPENLMLKKEITLLMALGGYSGHIIHISKDKKLTYVVGEPEFMPDSENTSKYITSKINIKNITIDKSYSRLKKTLTSSVILKINDLIKDEKSLLYDDKSVVKDDFQYHLYLDKEKKLFGYEANLNKYPTNAKVLIKLILKEVGELHDIGGGA